MNLSFSLAATTRSRYSSEKTATMAISLRRSARIAQAGKPGIVSSPTDATLSTISARMRLSNPRAYRPSGSTNICAALRIAALTDWAARSPVMWPLASASGPAGRFVLAMKPMDGPQVALHQGVLAELGEDLQAATRGKRTRQLRARTGEVLQLIAVLPQQLAV